MKLLTIGLLALTLLTAGCATTGDVKQVSERVDKMKVALDCQGNVLEIFLLYQHLSVAANAQQQDTEAILNMQLQLQDAQARAKFNCQKYDDQLAADKKASEPSK